LGEEAWQMLGHSGSLAYHAWPKWEEDKCIETEVVMAVQVQIKKWGEEHGVRQLKDGVWIGLTRR
jgi:leucyl-tRNA synthetase